MLCNLTVLGEREKEKEEKQIKRERGTKDPGRTIRPADRGVSSGIEQIKGR